MEQNPSWEAHFVCNVKVHYRWHINPSCFCKTTLVLSSFLCLSVSNGCLPSGFFFNQNFECISVVSYACHISLPSNQPQFDYLYNILCTVNTQHTSCLMYVVYWRCIIYYTDLIIHDGVASLKFIPSWITLIILDEQYRSSNSLVHKFLCPSITSPLLGKLQRITRYDWYIFICLFIYLFIYSLFNTSVSNAGVSAYITNYSVHCVCCMFH